MSDEKTKARERIGLPPGSLVYTGRYSEVSIQIIAFAFETGEIQHYNTENLNQLIERISAGEKIWVHIIGLHDTDLVGEIGLAAGLSELILEDILNAEHTANFDFDENAAIAITKQIVKNEEKEEFDEIHFSVTFTANQVFSFQEDDVPLLDPIFRRLKVENSRLRKKGVDYLAYALLDTLADSHLEHVRSMRDRIEDLEEMFQDNPDADIQKRIHEMRQSISELRKVIWPFRDAVARMLPMEFRGFDKKTKPYLRDTLDHLNTCSQLLDSNREMLANMRDWYLASLSTKMNEVMKVLTIIATIFIPLTFLTGIYGMNFEYMPERSWQWSYPVLLGIMVAIAAGMLVYFWRKKWF
jgi:magnesium transporter